MEPVNPWEYSVKEAKERECFKKKTSLRKKLSTDPDAGKNMRTKNSFCVSDIQILGEFIYSGSDGSRS